MLKFTTAQELAVNQAREEFNRSQTAMASDSLLIGNAAPIPLDAWRRIDARGAMIQRDVLAVFNSLAAASSTPIGVADIVNFYPQVSDSGNVQFSMDGQLSNNGDQANVKYVGTPVPVIHAEPAVFGWRQMEVMRKGGQLDQSAIANNQRKVAEAMEDMAVNGKSSIVVGGNTIYGLRTFPQRNTNTHGFDLSATTGANWLAAFQKLVNALIGDNAFGRVTVYLNYADYVYADMNEFVAGYPKTIMARMREIGQIANIIPCSKIPADEIIGIADLASGEWGSVLSAMPMVTRAKARLNPEDNYVFDTIAMAAPQFKADYDGRSRIAHITAA